MPALTINRAGFTGGEIAPLVHGRTDIAKYPLSLKTAINMMVHVEGPVSNRAGSEFVGPAGVDGTRQRCIPFKFNTVETYCLEFGNLYMRVIRDGAYVLDSLRLITGDVTSIAKAVGCLVSTPDTSAIANGDHVYISGVEGMVELNDRFLTVSDLIVDTSFKLKDRDGVYIDSTNFTAFIAGTTDQFQSVYEIVTLFTEADLRNIDYVQSGDVMTLVVSYGTVAEGGRDEVVQDLTRTADDLWTITTVAFAPSMASPAGLAVDAFPATGSIAMTGMTKASPAVITTGAAHGFSVDDEVALSDIVESSGSDWTDALNDKKFLVDSIPLATTMTIRDIVTGTVVDSSGFAGTFTSGQLEEKLYRYRVTAVEAETGEESLPIEEAVASITLTSSLTIALIITAPPTDVVDFYNIYKESNGFFGFIGQTEELRFVDDNIAPVLSDASPPLVARNPFSAIDKYPGVVAYYKQRRAFARPNGNRQTVYLTQVGNINNMNVSRPQKADDAVTFSLPSRLGGEIQHLIQMDDLFVLTTEDIWRSTSGDNAYSIENIRNIVNNAAKGSSKVKPLIIGGSILYVQFQVPVIWELVPDEFDALRTVAKKRTILASHIFEQRTIVDWAFSSYPFSLIYIILDDGTFAILTWDAEQDLWAFCPQITDGEVESVAVVPEEGEDYVYISVKREIGSSDTVRRFFERYHSRVFTDVQDAFFVDCGKSLDLPIPITTPGSVIQAVEPDGTIPIKVTSTTHGLSSNDPVDFSDIIGMTELNSTRALVAQVTANSFYLMSEYFTEQGSIYNVSQENPALVNHIAHGRTNGDIVLITGAVDSTEVNDVFYKVANSSANTYKLNDILGAAIDATSFGTNTAITGISQASPAVVTSVAHGRSEGENIRITGVQGMFEVEGFYIVGAPVNPNNFTLKDLDGVDIDSSGFGAWTSGGTIQPVTGGTVKKATFIDGVGFTAWKKNGKVRKALKVVPGYYHLIGETVNILANGNVEPQQIVASDGTITLSKAFSRVHVGLPYTSDLETLQINDPSGSLSGSTRSTARLVMRLYRTRGLKIGPSLTKLVPHKERNDEGYNQATGLQTGEAPITIPPKWDREGSIAIRQEDPLPVTLQTLSQEFQAGNI